VQFSCAANASGLDWIWDFGDGSTASGASTSHTYSAAGVYQVTVSASGNGESVTGSLSLNVLATGGGLPPPGVDSDADGVSDLDEALAGTNPHNPNSRPGGPGDFDADGIADDLDTDDDNDGVDDGTETSSGTDPFNAGSVQKLPMTVSRLGLMAKFNQTGKDSCSVSGVIPNVPANTKTAGMTIMLNVGGAVGTFTLDARGKARTAAGSVQLKLKGKRNAATRTVDFAGGDVPFKAKLVGDFADEWLDEGIDPAANTKMDNLAVVVDLSFGGKVYTSTVNGKYTGQASRAGRFKK